MSEPDLIARGSETAKAGFRNEEEVIERFNQWQTDEYAPQWLVIMGYRLEDIEYVRAMKITGSFKADVQVQIQVSIKLKSEIDVQNLQVKLVSNPAGYNQIDKRWIDSYVAMWDIPPAVVHALKLFTGELPPMIPNPRDPRRMFLDELPPALQSVLLSFFERNQTLIVSDILKGRGQFSAEWFLVILRLDTGVNWALKPINFALNFYGNGQVRITSEGSLRIGRITMQRKGGDGGRRTAVMLQFKLNPALVVTTRG